MAVVSYIYRDRPTAAQMNALWGEFDRKLTKILSGKTFLLSRQRQFNGVLMGKIFYFTPAPAATVYGGRAPGFTQGDPSGVVIGPDGQPIPSPLTTIPYDHQVFVNAVAAVAADIAANPSHATWDHASRIVTVPPIPASAYAYTNPAYGSLPMEWPSAQHAVGLCEHSLAAHYLLHQGPGDTEPRKYYLQEQGAVPEKRYRFALAELVVEGQSTLNIPDEWDKYNCFRIHNCNHTPLTVSFGSHYSITLSPYGCATVRRDSVSENYRKGFTYFFKFEKGDPRFARFDATQLDVPNYPNKARIGGSSMMRVSNSCQANNLTNPLCLYDWIGYMAITEDWLALYTLRGFEGGTARWGVLDLGGTGDLRFAWFARDPSVVFDAHPANAKHFGDPNDPATLLADLIYHPGKIIVARTSRTDVDPETGHYRVTFSEINFRGFATIVEDFAAGGVTVYTETNTAFPSYGQLCFKNAQPDICELVPVSTNLFKYWDATLGEEVHLPNVCLHDQWNQNTPTAYTPAPSINLKVFETNPTGVGGGPFTLGPSAQPLVFQRNLRVRSDSRSWYDIHNGSDGGPLGQTWYRTLTVPDARKETVVPGPVGMKTLQVTQGAPAWSCKPLHQVTVGDILDLGWWGNPQLTDQGTPYVQFTNKKLTLTPEGLVFSWDETISAYPPATTSEGGDNNGMALSGDQLYWKMGQLTRKRVAQFRGHGWGHTGGGSKTVPFTAPRAGKRLVQTSAQVQDEVSGAEGKDFSFPNRSSSETGHRMLRRMKQSELTLPDVRSRLWRNHGTDVDVILKNYRTAGWWGNVTYNGQYHYWATDPSSPRALDGFGYPTNARRLTDGSQTFLLPLLVEHYNGMAAAVNSLKTGYGLTCACLMWRVGGQLVSLAPGCGITDAAGAPIPEPLDCFASFPGEGGMITLANYLGITVNGPPATPAAPETPQNVVVMFTGTVSGGVTDAVAPPPQPNPYDPEGPPGPPNGWGSCTVTYTATMTPHPIAPGDLARGIAPAGKGWTPGPMPPDGAVGDYYVCTQSGWDGGTFWLKGDLLVWNDMSFWGGFNAGWTRIRGAQQSPGFAYVPATGQWIQIDAQAVGVFNHPLDPWAVATNDLGLWDPNGDYPSSTGRNRGDYYIIDGTSRARNAFDGGKLIWDGTAWRASNSQYCDFHWISIRDVKEFMEGLGFSMVYNELCIPLNLAWEEQAMSVSQYGVSTLTQNVTFDLFGQWHPWGHGNSFLEAAQSLPVNVTNVATARVGPTGARWQFSTATDDNPSNPDYPAWKIRMRSYVWNDLVLVDLRNWGPTGTPPAFVGEFFTVGVWGAGYSALWFGDWLVMLPEGANTFDLNVGPPASGTPISRPGVGLWRAAMVGNNDKLFARGRAEAATIEDRLSGNYAVWQRLALGVLCANSEDTNPQSWFTSIPIGNFITDGDAATGDGWAFEKLCWSGVLPYVWKAPVPEDTPQTVMPANGLTMLQAQGSTGVCTVQYSLNLNAISL